MTSFRTMWEGTNQDEYHKDSQDREAYLGMDSASKHRSDKSGRQVSIYKRFSEYRKQANDKTMPYTAHYRKPRRLYRSDIPEAYQLDAAETIDGVIDVLYSLEFNEIAERLSYLQKVVAEEEGEGGDPIEFQSVKNFGIFIIRKHNLPIPQIGITLEGLIHVVWDQPEIGTLVMNFLVSGDIEFTCLYHQHAPKSQRRRISGVLPPHSVMRYLSDIMRTPVSK